MEAAERCGHRNVNSHQKLEKVRKDSPPEPWEGAQPC